MNTNVAYHVPVFCFAPYMQYVITYEHKAENKFLTLAVIASD